MTGAPASLLTTNLLDHALKMHSALVSQDIDAMERLLLEGEQLVAALAARARHSATASGSATAPCCAPVAPTVVHRLRSLHESSARIVRARLCYLNALRALLGKSSTYGTAGVLPYRTRCTLSVRV
ncbi:MAG: hypothetical protein Q8P50_13910 [Bacillota bacterium]|nr:hypothetical protein [Bacillota bacterium]